MSAEFSESPLADNPLPEAVRQFEQEQQTFYTSLEKTLGNPHSQRLALNCKASSDSTSKAFQVVIESLAADPELSYRERASSIATFYFKTEKNRLDLFRKLAPAGDYEEGDSSFDAVVENIEDCFKSGMSSEKIGEEVTRNYLIGLAVDLEEVLDGAVPSRKTRAIMLAKDIGGQALEVGKIAAGVAIGALVARKMLDRGK